MVVDSCPLLPEGASPIPCLGAAIAARRTIRGLSYSEIAAACGRRQEAGHQLGDEPLTPPSPLTAPPGHPAGPLLRQVGRAGGAPRGWPTMPLIPPAAGSGPALRHDRRHPIGAARIAPRPHHHRSAGALPWARTSVIMVATPAWSTEGVMVFLPGPLPPLPSYRRPWHALGNRLLAARHAQSWRQHHIAWSLRIPIGMVAQWERGRHRPSSPNLHRLAELLDVPYAELAELAGYPPSGL